MGEGLKRAFAAAQASRAKPEFTAAECDECGATIERQQDEKACPKCSGYFHKGDCYRGHCDKQHRN